ncbi:hypothetical protein [Bradyrhizobium sp. LTSP857]|uniref:hypothetical protein n=1 Tax=Bradyrhizobium sp. LTSP857 TaxID=1619231 RepID=UPI000B155175|nr:hypothetical protein [Bradyrhizobium sp. LTSP857]
MAHILNHNPAAVHAPAGGYSLGVELGQYRRLLFISGQVPEASDGAVPEGFDGDRGDCCGMNPALADLAMGQLCQVSNG